MHRETMAAIYEKNLAFKRAKDAEMAQKKELQELAEMRECTFKPKINKSFRSRGGAPSYTMDVEVRMPSRLRHLHIPSIQTRHDGRRQPEKSPTAAGGSGDMLDGIQDAFEQLESDLNQRHFVVRALENETRRLRLVSAFARANVPSAQQHLGGDFKWPVTSSELQGSDGAKNSSEGYSNETAEVEQLQLEAHELVDGLVDYVSHSTTYITNLLWEFDQVCRFCSFAFCVLLER